MSSNLKADQQRLRIKCFDENRTKEEAIKICGCSKRAWEQWSYWHKVKLNGVPVDKKAREKKVKVVLTNDDLKFYKHNDNSRRHEQWMLG